MADLRISGKVFRFLSAMHPALSKAERKRYAGYDPEHWYDWTAEVAAEFSDLMKRSPRDTSFARGFAYVAQKSVPEGRFVPVDKMIAGLPRLAAAFDGPQGNGFEVEMTSATSAHVTYGGMPGFDNACIAVVGELEQRMQAAGARGIEAGHVKGCRLQGEDRCHFEVSWSGAAAPKGLQPISLVELLGDDDGDLDGDGDDLDFNGAGDDAPAEDPTDRHSTDPAAAKDDAAADGDGDDEAADANEADAVEADATEADANEADDSAAAPAAEAATSGRSRGGFRRPSATPARPSAPADAASDSGPAAAGSEDLFDQLKSRLVQAEETARRHGELEATIEALRGELDEVRREADARVAEARKATDRVGAELADLKRRIRELADQG